MFEVTGRFYETGKAEATATTQLNVGSRRSKARVDSGDQNARSNWSYKNTYQYKTGYYWNERTTAEYDARHLKSTAWVNVRNDKNVVLKGVHDSPATNQDINVEYSRKDYFAVSFYRQSDAVNHDYKSGNNGWTYQDLDDWANKVSFADEIYLEDTLPKIRKDDTNDYYGFLTEDILISEELYLYIDRIELTKQKVIKDSSSTAVPDSSDGMKGYKTTVEQTPFMTLTQSDLGAKDADNNYKILFKYKEKDADAVSNAANEIVFEQEDYLYSYKIVLKNIPGSADYARELLGNTDLKVADFHGDSSKVDIKVGGYVYLIKDINPVSDATNSIKSTLKNDSADTLYDQNTDTAYLMGFRLPFKAGYKIEGRNSEAIQLDYESVSDSSNNVEANITPHTTTFGIKVWNQNDGDDPVKDKASRIKTVEITSNLDTHYNLKKIHIPGEFIDGTWFNVTSIKLNYTLSSGNASTTFDYDNANVNTKDITPYLIKVGTDYYFDVNKFISEIAASLPQYTVDNSAETYLKEHINSFVLTMSAVNSDVEKEETLLAASQYLSADKNEGYAVTYDGVWVDRTEDDVANNVWSAESRPTFGMTPNQYPALSTTTTTAVKFTAADFNAENYQGNVSGTTGTKNYNIANLVGKMEVAIDRGTKINGSNSFAYDRSENQDGTIVELPVDQKHIVPYDYIDYTLSLKASNDSPIPLQHADLRFTAPDGQRIVGWKIKNNGTANISDDDMTAFVKGTNTDVPMLAEHYYLLDNNGAETNYKELNLSIGDTTKSELENQIQAGEMIEIIVYTQMNDELKDNDGNPAFEGKTVTAKYEAVCQPKHTYSQYSISGNGNTTAYYGDSAYSSDNDVVYYRKKTDFYGKNGTPYKGNDYTSIITSNVTFKDSNDLFFDYSFTDKTTQYDGQEMTLKVTGKDSVTHTKVDAVNDLHHDVAEMIFEVSFLSKETTSAGVDRYFKGFDLTKKPTFEYPENMTSAQPIKIEYLFDVNGVDEWVDESLVNEPSVSRTAVLSTTYLTTEAKKIRWTYYDVPAFGTDGNEIVFATQTNPFIFEGLGRYNDIRETDSTPIKDRYTMVTEGKVTPIHQHKETVDNTIDGIKTPISVDNLINYYGEGEAQVSIARERPVLTYQTQIFDSQEKAEANYDPAAVQKNGYRPNDTMWYKVSVINNKLSEAEAATGNQGVLLDPVFYDKVPEYVSADMDHLQVRWLNADGTVKTDAPKIQTKVLTTVTASDYGGDMVVPKSSVKEGEGGNLHGKNFDDIIPNKDNSTEINYTVYEFSFEGNARLEVGETIEIWYEATAREENLPMVYVNDNGNVYPEYYPKMGEYYQTAYRSSYGISGWPLINTSRSGSSADGRIRAVNNSGIMMDMSYLIHDVGISGTLNTDVDRWEFLTGSTTYIPGSESNDTNSNYSLYGSNNVLMDYDSASGSIYQKVKYVPSVTGNNLDIMPTGSQYQVGNANRDMYKYVVQPRTNLNESSWDNKTLHTPILWSEARSHLQTAWLAASSQIIPNQEAGEAGVQYTNHALEYLNNGYTNYFKIEWANSSSNPNYSYYVYDNYGQHARHALFPDDSIPTIEYDESYNARLSAYNYGDWSLDGVEFIYVLPRGVSPQRDESGNIVISGTTLTSGNSYSGGYTAIDPANITVQVIQDPNALNSGYLSPKKVQDPYLVQTKINTTTDIYDNSNEYYDAADAQSWVLKVTVNQDLKKWFNRGSDTGYILNVDIGCHVDSTNESEYWYDKVFAKPIDSENSLYYQIYDITSWQGATKVKSYKNGYGSLSTQFGGMDYLWDGYDDANDPDLATNYNNGSPNMPYINGFNIQNSEVTVDTDINGIEVNGNLKSYYGSGSTNTYAATGTRAHMRKPLIRTWTTMGDDIDGADPNAYYLNPEADQGILNIHVENNYYWNDQSTNGNSPLTGSKDSDSALRHLHNYSTDGGNQGTLFFPVITNILPEGVVPKDVNGDPFTKDNTVNAGMTLKWDIYDGQTKTNINALEKDLYTTKVEYIELDKEDGSGKEGRFKVTFYQDKTTQGNDPDAKIVSGDTRVYSIDLVTVKEPDKTTKDGTENSELLAQYQSNHTYVTSQLTGFKFITDSDINANPYNVGIAWSPFYAGKYNTGDGRKDAIARTLKRPGSSSYITGGVLPNIPVSILNTSYEVIDATNHRYNENDTFNLEDYTDIRANVKLSDDDKDFDLSGFFTHTDVPAEGDFNDQGVHTSMRIRTKHARLEVENHVGDKEDSTDAMRDTDTVQGVDHYPTVNFDNQNYIKTDQDHRQYADHLWYTTKVSNIPANDADYMHKGDIKHAKIIVSVKLPSIVTYQEQYYLEYKDDLGQTIKLSKDDIENPDPAINHGWQIKNIDTVIDPDTNEETQIFEIITPGETTDYDEYLTGKNLAGYFGTGDSFELKMETVIDHLDTPNTVLAGDDYWDNRYYAQSYVTFHELDGGYLGMSDLTEQSADLVEFVREVQDQKKEPTDPNSKDIDYDGDGDLEERYASDTSARVTILKPQADIRLDTSIKRNQLNNPDAGIVVAEDPSIKGATLVTVYMDEVVNRGGAVSEFVVDYRVPYRGTTSGTIYEAPMSAPELNSSVRKIRTGVWELPDQADYKGPSSVAELQNKLKVHIYALVVSDPGTFPYTVPGASGEYTGSQWKDLGIYGLTDNQEIDVENLYYAESIVQIRYVIKAEDPVDTKATQKYPVPQGFRLDIDADSTTSDKKEEMDEIDPNRDNVKELPDSVKNNAAYIQLTTAHKNSTTVKLHANNFATAWARYDDTQYSALSNAARAGYFVNTELPAIQVDLVPYYFHRYKIDEENYGFEWSDTDMVIKQGFSTMLKYKMTIKNLTDDEIAMTDFAGEEQDNATGPEISAILPYMEDIMDTKYNYVDAHSQEYADSFVNTAYTSDERIERDQAQWTYYVQDSDGNIKANSRIKDVDFKSYKKSADLSGTDRKILTWSFDGYLEPGETVAVEFMVPIGTKDFGMISPDLLNCSGFGFLQGSFKGYIPPSENTNETYSIEIDSRDINNNGKTISEATLVKRVGGISFESKQALNRLKFAYSEYDTSGLETTRPALVPEGTDYNFRSVILNPDNYGEPGYKQAIIYDVLPYANDKNIVNPLDRNDPDSPAASRDSAWAGWVMPETIKVSKTTTPATGGTVTTELVDNTDYEAWIGPFEKSGGTINLKDISQLPAFKDTQNTEFYSKLYADENLRRQYFVKLSELKALQTTDNERYKMLSKNIQAIWVQIKDRNDLGLDGSMKFELNYSLHSPLNLPQYNGAITSDLGDDVIRQSVANYTGWNTFAVQAKASNNDNPISVVESPRAGVYLNAPVEKGYIGSYVWYDANYNANIDEGEYVRRDDGRLIFKNKTKDLDYDGINDDPGINGVLVELLSENGYPVNKLGEAVVEEEGTGKFILVDEATGLKKKDVNGTYLYTIYGPATYTTEADAYGNNGYFVISNVTPGNYKLRYTFPEKTYNTHALTTLEIGDTKAKMDIYRDGDTLPDLGNPGQGDVESDAQTVTNKLIVQTADSIRIDAIGSDPSTYAAYDAKMTSYNVGVSRAYVYGGTAWVDETQDPTDPDNIISDGLIGAAEERLENVDITFYEVTDTGLVQAINADGKPAVTKSDADGNFEMSLYPDRSYIARVNTSNTNGVYKPSPITLNTDPKAQNNDNDLILSDDKLYNQTFTLHTGVEFDASGKPIMNADGNYYGKYNYIGLGFVEAGRGYLGKYVWDDKNYDGIRGDYLDQDGNLVSEPGLKDIKFILEKYYYDDVDNIWKPVPDAPTTEQFTNTGGSYTFQNVKTTYTLGDKVYLAGYKIKVDPSTLPSDYAVTKYQMNSGRNDSDLPILSSDGYLTSVGDHDATSQMIIIAEKADEHTQADYIKTYNGVDYNTAEGRMILDLDIGLTSKDKASFTGIVWDDKNYDGIQNQYQSETGLEDEPGIADIELEVMQYYYKDSQWIKNEAYVSPTVKTDANGVYTVNQLDSYIVVDGQNYITGYKVHIKDIDSKYAVTKYKATTDTTLDSNLIDENLNLTEDNEYLVVAKKVNNLNYAPEYIIKNNLGNFDIHKVENIDHYDAGLTAYEKAEISGKIWDDKNYDGIINKYKETDDSLVDEPGINNVTLHLEQYYLDENQQWKQVPVSLWDPENHQAVTDADGNYLFKDVDTHVVINGQRYLAGYKVTVDQDTIPNKENYGITLYRVNIQNDERNSDLSSQYKMQKEDEYIITADKVAAGKENTPYIIELKGNRYDLVTAADSDQHDGGLTLYQKSTISGNVFADEDYDGLYDTEESYSDIKDALATGQKLEVTLTSYYLDENSVWQPLINVGVPVQRVTEVDENGQYVFDQVPTQVYVNDKHYLAGYKLSINLIPEGFGVTKYLRNSGQNDSALYKAGTDLLITKTSPDDGYTGTAAEETNGYIIAAYHNKANDIVNSSSVINGYDLIKSRELNEYNVGYTDKVGGNIIGTIFEDKNYDGFYDETKEVGINDIEVFIEQYYLDDDNHWVRTDATADYASTLTQTVNSHKGIFEFKDLPTHVTLADGSVHLASYKVRIDTIPNEYGITHLNMRTGESDTYDEIRDSDLVYETGYLNLNDGKNADDENIIVAYPLQEDDVRNEQYIYSYKGQDYDILLNRTVNDYDAGLVPYQLGSIEGDIWLDSSENGETSYNGIKDQDEQGIADQNVILSQYLLKNGKWELVEDEYLTGMSDENGHYLFSDLPVYKEEADGTRYLYGYQLRLEEMIEDYAVTKYRQGEDPTKDNDLSVETSSMTEAKEYIILAKNVTNDAYINKPYTIKVDNGWFRSVSYYDILVGENNKDYSAGFTEYQLGSIEGIAFVDSDYDGIFNNSDSFKEGILVQLKRYYYNSDERKWIEDDRSPRVIEENPKDDENTENTERPESIYRQFLTGSDGHYRFDNLETYKEVDGKRYVYGYELWINGIPQGYAATKYQQNAGIEDSALNASTLQIIKNDPKLPEMNKGLITIAENVSEESYQNLYYTIGDYDIIAAKHLTDYNVGLTTIDEGTISGMVWEDDDYNGIQHESERGLSDIKVTLETYYYQNSKWHLMEDQHLTATTSADGSYEFNHLATFSYVDNEQVLLGYKVKIETLPKGYNVSDYQLNGQYLDSDLNEETGYLEHADDYIVLAQKADHTIDPSYVLNGYNFVKVDHETNLDAGLTPYKSGSIEAILFEDENSNGIFDEGESVISGQQVMLEVMVENSDSPIKISSETGIAEDGIYQLYNDTVMTSNEEGRVEFKDIPMLNEETNELYRYRLRMIKPEQANFTYVKANDIHNEGGLNGYGKRHGLDSGYSEHDGITHSFELVDNVQSYVSHSNYYGLMYKPQDILKEGKLYLGLSYAEPVSNIDTGDRNSIIRIAGLMLVSGLVIAMLNRKKKEEE
ncbi:MAG: SdrD B-like domain-containing protein [Beduini sp.]|uniref:SdrD B-like domain-containing protein n=1 Tax=Beduini sp. TaxID=1922300 RepID=UPI0039A3C601